MVTIQLDPGSLRIEELDLEPGEAIARALPPAPRPAPPPDPAERAPRTQGGNTTTAWVALGIGAGLVGLAGAALYVRNSNAATYDDDSLCYQGGLTRDQRCGSYRNIATAAEVTSIAALGAAAAAFTVAAVVFARAPSGKANPPVAVGCTLGSFVACSATF
jgi:hypothetical protein